MLLAAAPYWKGRAPALEQPLGAGPAAAMLYLEDYLEMIEQLPMDLRDRFTEMREMDLQVQST